MSESDLVSGKAADPLPVCNARLSDELERLGDTCSEDGAASAAEELRARLKHPAPGVREGAVYGLARLAQRFPAWAPEVVVALSDTACQDDSAALREAAREALEDIR